MTEDVVKVIAQEAVIEYGVIAVSIASLLILLVATAIYFGLKKKLHKDIEALKVKNEKANHISKTQFEIEFEIYQKAYNMMCDLARCMGLDAATKLGNDITKTAHKKHMKFSAYIKSIAPFINEEIYSSFTDFVRVSNQAMIIYGEGGAFFRRKDELATKEDIDNLNAYYENVIGLNHQIEDFAKKVRNYLSSLTVYN